MLLLLIALFPNLIHHIDSLILNGVIKSFREEKKILFSIHDAFYVTMNDIQFLKEAYYNSLKDVYDLQPYKKILEANKLSEDDFLEPSQTELKDIKKINRSIDKLIQKIPPIIKFEPMDQNILK